MKEILLAVIGAFGTGGIGIAYFKYRTEKPQADADVVVTFANGWENYANKLESRIEAIEKENEKRVQQLKADYEKRIADLQKSVDEQNKLNEKIISEKDAEIADLRKRIKVLEHELLTYKK